MVKLYRGHRIAPKIWIDPATDVYESTDDYDQITFVRDANQHHWLQDCKTLAMTQRDLNYLTRWVYDVKAAHTIRNNDGDFEGTPTQLNF